MKNKKQYILAILAGELFFIFFILGQNANIFKSSIYVNIVGIILGTLLLYSLVITLISSSKINYNLVGLGYARAYIIFIATFFISIFIKQFLFTKETTPVKTIIEREQLEFVSNYKDCYMLKYGTFLVDDRDTIIRNIKNNKELETVITNGKTNVFNVKWIDSCTYLRINTKSGLVAYKVKLGNINEVFHNLYISPAGLHKLGDEKVLNSITIE